MGSGLILLLIVGMWLAVLVPMWLKSYDSGANLSSVDRFSDAMRVLSRRHVAMGDRRTLLMPPRPRAVLSAGPGPSVPPTTERAARIEAALARTVPSRVAPSSLLPSSLVPSSNAASLRSTVPAQRSGADRPVDRDHHVAPAPSLAADTSTGLLTPAARRLRTLLLLVGAAGLTLVLTLVWPALLLAHLLVDALVVGFVVRCRRLAVQRAAHSPVAASFPAPATAPKTAPKNAPKTAPTTALVPAQPDRSASASTRPAAAVPRPVVARVAGVPDRMPSRPAALTSFVPAQAARRADEIAARPAAPELLVSAASVHGEPWSPVPVPVPIYVTMPSAPAPVPAPVAAPAARVVDLTHPGKWSDTLAAADDGLQSFADDSQLEELVGRRRAAGDW